jgi:polysaccharide export outer membrane protein
VLEIRVLDEPELTSDYRVLGDGTITYPYCGRVQVAGKTPAELEQHLRGCLSDFVLDAQLSVLVKERGQRITVLGSVARPGAYSLEPGLTALQAVALAGGLSEGAPASAVLTRRDEAGELRRYPLSLWAISRGEAGDVLLKPGDTLYVSASR